MKAPSSGSISPAHSDFQNCHLIVGGKGPLGVPQGPEPKDQSGQAWKSTDIGSAAADFSTSKFLRAKPGLTNISEHKP